nr:Chain A, Esterase/lipase [uncultured bacterium]3K6K_B Chain B, Esterase/lipase [uncultured bacterium]3K6K_C Chain C, Esterase/lipase [uncultured bacterium]3K6K_D Chain D, Esterase/lipase [uncultured bacterium]
MGAMDQEIGTVTDTKMDPRDFLQLLKINAEKAEKNLPLDQKRAGMEALCERFPRAEGVELTLTDLGGVPCIRQATDGAGAAHILYFHGGGYISGSPSTHLVLTTQLAKQSSATLWSLDYRLAPENPFPAAVDDCVAAYRALLKTAGSADRIIIAGDSAGGGLTTASMLKAKEDGLPMPAGLVMLSPFVDLTLSRWSNSNLADRDFLAEPDTLGEMSELYVGGEDRKNPLISPVYADLSGLPEMLIHVGSEEALLSDSTTLAERAGAAGVSVELKIWPDMPHVFQMYGKFVNAADISIKEICHWISARISKLAAALEHHHHHH